MQNEAPQMKTSKNDNVKNELTAMEVDTHNKQNVEATFSGKQQMHKRTINGTDGLAGKVTPYERKVQKKQDKTLYEPQVEAKVANTVTKEKKLCKERFFIKEKTAKIENSIKTMKQNGNRKRKLDGQAKQNKTL